MCWISELCAGLILLDINEFRNKGHVTIINTASEVEIVGDIAKYTFTLNIWVCHALPC